MPMPNAVCEACKGRHQQARFRGAQDPRSTLAAASAFTSTVATGAASSTPQTPISTASALAASVFGARSPQPIVGADTKANQSGYDNRHPSSQPTTHPSATTGISRSGAARAMPAPELGHRAGDELLQNFGVEIGKALEVQAGFADPVRTEPGKKIGLLGALSGEVHDQVLAADGEAGKTGLAGPSTLVRVAVRPETDDAGAPTSSAVRQ